MKRQRSQQATVAEPVAQKVRSAPELYIFDYVAFASLFLYYDTRSIRLVRLGRRWPLVDTEFRITCVVIAISRFSAFNASTEVSLPMLEEAIHEILTNLPCFVAIASCTVGVGRRRI